MTQPNDSTDCGAELHPAEFEAIRTYLYAQTGIALGDNKTDMVYSRLMKRLRHLGLRSFGLYLARARADDPAGERQEFVNALTTNKTDFFREGHHFDFLRETVIPRFQTAGRQRLRVWCAASSTGEEPYTLAMTFRDACPPDEGWDVKILASDIDTTVLATAERGVYAADRVRDLPPDLLRRHFLRGTGANSEKVAVRPELKDMLAFRQVNLIAEPWPMRHPFDVIFCRNVVIYFDRETQRKLLTRFAAQLAPDGYLFMGHSENIHWMGDTFAPLGNTVYRPRLASDTPLPRAVPTAALKRAPKAEPEEEEHIIILGDVKATNVPAVIKTLLGSCVAACLYDPETGIGGMNHFSLPGVSDEGANARYGAYAMELLITSLMKKGADRSRLKAKVFGGGRVLDMASERLNVGARNAAFVLRFLDDEGIPVVAQDLGGERGRMVRFRPHTGQAFAKPLAGRELPPVVEREVKFTTELFQQAEAPPADDGITLF
jgi:chemotaxis protein methyltransferase CheR